MARSKEATKAAKAAYSRKYRREHAAKVRAYNQRTVKERASRNEARAKMIKKYGKARLRGKDIHHRSGSPKNNSAKNLAIAKAHHSGGAPGNQNARKKRKRR